MMYVFYCEDGANTLEARRLHRPEHLARLKALQNEGRLFVAGPCPAIDSADPGAAGFTGSLIVAEFPSFEAAHAWAAADPFSKCGVYSKVTVKPFLKALP
ncbi:MAG: YciI family protein [Chromatiales bacterium]|jgi:uncharacterized protein YciI|nr:YciI family protein [Chromatiales bacterium]